MKPTTGIGRVRITCCAFAASGRVTAAPPISVMNVRRFMSPPAAAYDALGKPKSNDICRAGQQSINGCNQLIRLEVECLHGVRGSGQLHSITSSARITKGSGTVTPIALAVLRFTASLNFVGSCTGRSPGRSPRKTRSTYSAVLRKLSSQSTL